MITRIGSMYEAIELKKQINLTEERLTEVMCL